MDLSRRDAFRPYSRHSSGDKVNFVLLAKKKKNFFNGNRPPYFLMSKDETRRDGSNPFIVILSLNHYSFCETMSQVLLS